MPKVFKGRRNILRSPNKSKREHFTQGNPLTTDKRDAFRIKIPSTTANSPPKLFNIKLSGRAKWKVPDYDRPGRSKGGDESEKIAGEIYIYPKNTRSNTVIDNKIILSNDDASNDFSVYQGRGTGYTIGIKKEEQSNYLENTKVTFNPEIKITSEKNSMGYTGYYLTITVKIKSDELGDNAGIAGSALNWSFVDDLIEWWGKTTRDQTSEDGFLKITSKFALPVAYVEGGGTRVLKIGSYGRLIEYFDKYDQFLGENDSKDSISIDDIPTNYNSDVKYIRISATESENPFLSKPVIYKVNNVNTEFEEIEEYSKMSNEIIKRIIQDGGDFNPAVEPPTQDESVAAFKKRMDEMVKKRDDLVRRGGDLNPPVMRGSDEARTSFETKVKAAESERDDLVRRGKALNPPVTRDENEIRADFKTRVKTTEEKVADLEKRGKALNPSVTRKENETRTAFESAVKAAEEKVADLVMRGKALNPSVTRDENEARADFETRVKAAEAEQNMSFGPRWGQDIGSSGSIRELCQVSAARNLIGLDSDPNLSNCESFSQRPANFPDSKLDSFSQGYVNLLALFDTEAKNLVGMVGPTGSYQMQRGSVLGSIGSDISSGTYRSVALLSDMSSALYEAGQDVQAKINRLEQIKTQYNNLLYPGSPGSASPYYPITQKLQEE